MSTVVALGASIRHGTNAGGAVWSHVAWAQALRDIGCRVWWLEGLNPERRNFELESYIAGVKADLAQFSLSDALVFCAWTGDPSTSVLAEHHPTFDEIAAEADLFLNVSYFQNPRIIERFRRSVFVDTDPGLLQLWLNTGQMTIPRHDLYFSAGAGVGKTGARFPDCGLRWLHSPEPVYLPAWRPAAPLPDAALTTVSNWWAAQHEYILYGGQYHDNSKRAAYLRFLDLPRLAAAPLELALTLGEADCDRQERQMLENAGWRVYPLNDIKWTPQAYADYVRSSRGEFACVKPFYSYLEPGLIFDRTLHYLASGRPAIVQSTGPIEYLPSDGGLFRFTTQSEALAAIEIVCADIEKQGTLARKLAEEYFDAVKVVRRVLEIALS